MTAVLASSYLDVPVSREQPLARTLGGAQTLLTPQNARQNFIVEGIAIAVYAVVLASLLTYASKPKDVTPEAPMELVMLPPPPPPAPPVVDTTPAEPEAVQPPEPQAQAQPEPKPVEPPPPPLATEPAVAPVAPPPPPKVVAKAKPKPAAPVVKPKRVAAPPRTDAASTARAAPQPGATASAIANQIHARLMRAAANAYPESQKPRSARVGYRVQIDAAGHVTSFSITPSGNAAFDSAAARLGGRIGAVDAPGRPASLSGSITFAYQ